MCTSCVCVCMYVHVNEQIKPKFLVESVLYLAVC